MKKETKKTKKIKEVNEAIGEPVSKQLTVVENQVDIAKQINIVKSDPEYHAVSVALDRVTIFSGSFAISTMQDIELGARALKEIDSLRERVNERYYFFINPLKKQQELLKNHIQEIKVLFDPMFIPLHKSEEAIEKTILEFKELERKRHEEEIKKLEEERKQKEEAKKQPPPDDIDSLFASSSSDFDFVPSTTPTVKSLPTPPPPEAAQKTIHTSAGDLTTRYDWKVEVTNLRYLVLAIVNPEFNLPIEILKPDISFLEGLARKGRTEIPGCKIEHKPSLRRNK